MKVHAYGMESKRGVWKCRSKLYDDKSVNCLFLHFNEPNNCFFALLVVFLRT